MFPASYFASSYFADSYWPKLGETVIPGAFELFWASQINKTVGVLISPE